MVISLLMKIVLFTSIVYLIKSEDCPIGFNLASKQIRKRPFGLWNRGNQTNTDRSNDGSFGVRFCAIPKNMSSTMRLMMCDIFRLIHGARELNPETVKYCFQNVGSTPRTRKEEKNNFSTFLISRDPIERFVSAYIMICLKFGNCNEEQRESVHPFIDQLYNDFNGKFMPTWNGKRGDYVARHLGLQSWYCSPKLGKMFKMNDGLADEIERFLVEHEITLPIARTATDRIRFDHFSSNEMPEEFKDLRDHIFSEIHSNCSTLQKLTQIYFSDFIELSFPFPYFQPKPSNAQNNTNSKFLPKNYLFRNDFAKYAHEVLKLQ